jgi:ABC-type sugar transport system ATPase subunit
VSAVRLESVYKRFGELEVVKNANLSLDTGELCVFLGPSGCGKSTTLRMVAGLEPVTSGRIFIGERDVTDFEPRDRDIAMVFQNYALYPHKTVAQNLSFGLQMRGFGATEVERRVSEAASLLGLSELLQRKPKQLSGGQMQRVALGRALVRDPQVFLLDEPLSNLDAKLRVQMREEILKLHRRLGKAMIFVTHDQVEAMTLADRLVVMRDGEVQQIGTPLEIFDFPKNTFVATFIGSPEMNLLDMVYESGMLTCAGLSIKPTGPIPVAERSRLKVGIRPEHVQIADAGVRTDDGGVFEVEVVEQLGTSTLLVGKVDGQRMQVQGPRCGDRSGDKIPIAFQTEKLHLFDSVSGTRIPISEYSPIAKTA